MQNHIGYGAINGTPSSYKEIESGTVSENSLKLQDVLKELKSTHTLEKRRVDLSKEAVESRVVELNHDAVLHIGRNYVIQRFTWRFEDFPSDVNAVCQKAHRQLAQEYKTTAETKASEKGLGIMSYYDNYGRNFFGKEDQEYHEALRIIHLAIASQFGCAESSWELVEIYQKGEYFLPFNDIPRKNDIAVEYAATSQKQGKIDALHLLGELYQKDSFCCYSPYAIKCKDLANGKTTTPSDTTQGKHQGDTLDEHDIDLDRLTISYISENFYV